jgi:tRNA A37 N6-isopentenylltransferase MiaA
MSLKPFLIQQVASPKNKIKTRKNKKKQNAWLKNFQLSKWNILKVKKALSKNDKI